jgi:hypothetical protein
MNPLNGGEKTPFVLTIRETGLSKHLTNLTDSVKEEGGICKNKKKYQKKTLLIKLCPIYLSNMQKKNCKL